VLTLLITVAEFNTAWRKPKTLSFVCVRATELLREKKIASKIFPKRVQASRAGFTNRLCRLKPRA